MTTTIRRLLAAAILAAATLLHPTAAAAQVAPRVSLQTGIGACELQAVLENFPSGTVDLVFLDRAGHRFTFPVTFTGDEGGSDLLVDAGPFEPGTWTAEAGGTASQQHVRIGAECDQITPAAAPTATVNQPHPGRLPFTGTDPWPALATGLALAGLGGWLLRQGRSKGLRG